MSIKQLIKDIAVTNLATGIEESKLKKIGLNCYQGYQDDLGDPNRMKWAKNLEEYIKLAMQITETKSDPWEGCANIKTPLLTEAAIQFNARAYPAIIPSGDIVKCSTTGADPAGVKSSRGERVGKHMSYQLREDMVEWEDDMDKGLLILPILGCFFKKSFHNVDIGRNESKLVMPQNLVMEYKTPSIDRAPRLSEVIEFYPREVKEKQRLKTWLDVDLSFEDEDKEKIEEFVTQHTYLDLYEKSYKCPYIVTFHLKTQTVVRLVANYTESDIYYNDGTEIVSVALIKKTVDDKNAVIEEQNIENAAIAQQAEQTMPPVNVPEIPHPDFNKYKVSRVDSTKYYTKYGFLPSPDESIYDMGLGQLMGPLTDATDTLINQMLDAGTASNLQGGFRAKGIKSPSGTGRVNTTEWTPVETGGMAMKDAFLPFNFPGPSAVAFNLLGFLVDSAKAVANLKDILSGDAPAGETATTSMIKREEGMRIYNAIYKRIYRSFKQELEKIYSLNALYLPQEVYFKVLDTEEAVKKTDYSIDKTDITPTADPNESMQSQKILKAEALLPMAQDPEFNGYEIKKRYVEALEVENVDEILPPPSKEPKPPDPLLVKTTAEVKKLEAETKKILLETAEVISKIIKNLADAESKEAGQQLGMLKAHADFLIKQGTMDQKQAQVQQTGENQSLMQGPQSIEARADGGPVEAGKPYLVGENGPEIITPAEDGEVIPNDVIGGWGESVKADISKEYPGIGAHLENIILQKGNVGQEHRGQLEFYQSDERDNPNPGRPTIEVYNGKLSGEYLNKAIAGDMLHFLGGASNGVENDRTFSTLKKDFIKTITPEQESIDISAYIRLKNTGVEDRTYQQWRDASRDDAYIRGYLFPDEQDEWRKSGTYTPEQKNILEKMGEYLRGN